MFVKFGNSMENSRKGQYSSPNNDGVLSTSVEAGIIVFVGCGALCSEQSTAWLIVAFRSEAQVVLGSRWQCSTGTKLAVGHFVKRVQD